MSTLAKMFMETAFPHALEIMNYNDLINTMAKLLSVMDCDPAFEEDGCIVNPDSSWGLTGAMTSRAGQVRFKTENDRVLAKLATGK